MTLPLTEDKTRKAWVHHLKTHPQYFQAQFDGRKGFELRKNDRDFHVGDILHLREFDPDTGQYTEREIWVGVTYIAYQGEWLADGYVCMSTVSRPPP